MRLGLKDLRPPGQGRSGHCGRSGLILLGLSHWQPAQGPSASRMPSLRAGQGRSGHAEPCHSVAERWTLSERDPVGAGPWMELRRLAAPGSGQPPQRAQHEAAPGTGLGPTRFTCPESANLCILSERLTLVAATSFNGQILLQCLFVQCGVLHDFQKISNIKVRIKNA